MSLTVAGTDYVLMPVGTTAQRPTTPAAGMTRFNSTTSLLEYYNGTTWLNAGTAYAVSALIVSGGGGGGFGGGGTGGGGGATGSGTAGTGGSGVVIISIPTNRYSATYTGTPTITTSGTNTILQFNASGSYTA